MRLFRSHTAALGSSLLDDLSEADSNFSKGMSLSLFVDGMENLLQVGG